MRSASPAIVTAIGELVCVARDFIWMEPRHRVTGDREGFGFWSDVGNVSAQVVSGATYQLVTRLYVGAGTLIAVEGIPLVNDISVRNTEAQVSQVADEVMIALREYDPDQAPIEIHRGWFDPLTRNLVAPPEPLFVGFIDHVDIPTPPEGQSGAVKLSLANHTRELTRTNTEKRSDESQKLRSGDRFYQHTSTVGEWEIFWGSENGKMSEQGGGGKSSGGKGSVFG
jgi:hypothetical protein